MDEKKYPFLALVMKGQHDVPSMVERYLDDRPPIMLAIKADQDAFKLTRESQARDLDLDIVLALQQMPSPPTIRTIEQAFKTYIQERGGLKLTPADFVPQSISIGLALVGETGEKVARQANLWSTKSPTYKDAAEKYDRTTSYLRSYCQTPYGHPVYEEMRDGIKALIDRNQDMSLMAEDILQAEDNAFHKAIFDALTRHGFITKKEKTLFSKEKVEFNVGNQESFEMAILDGINHYRADQQARLAALPPVKTLASSDSIPIPSSNDRQWQLYVSDEGRRTPTDGLMPTPSSSYHSDSHTASSSTPPSDSYSSSTQRSSTGSSTWVSFSYHSRSSGSPDI